MQSKSLKTDETYQRSICNRHLLISALVTMQMSVKRVTKRRHQRSRLVIGIRSARRGVCVGVAIDELVDNRYNAVNGLFTLCECLVRRFLINAWKDVAKSGLRMGILNPLFHGHTSV